MGNLCFTGLIKNMFKNHYKHELVNLLCSVISLETDSDFKPDACESSKRVISLKQQMSDVRDIATSWDTMVQMCVNAEEQPCIFIKKTLDLMYKSHDDFYIGDVITMSTYVIDLCIAMVLKNPQFNVCEVVATAAEYMIDKKIVSCIHFLWYLDTL